MTSSSGSNIIKFCRNCNTMLSPRVDSKKKTLLYVCRNCQYEEVADNNCVYRNEVYRHAHGQTQEFQDVASNPTLPCTKLVRCPKCDHGEAVYYRAKSGREDGMTLLYVCAKPSCGHRWKD